MRKGTIIRIVIISVFFTTSLVYGIKYAALRQAAGAPPIVMVAESR